jgi:hypothetical protein
MPAPTPRSRQCGAWRQQGERDPDRVEIQVDIRALPGITSEEVEAMLKEAMGDLPTA